MPVPLKIRKAINSFTKDEQAIITKAYLFAEEKHQGQNRLSGDPYITHPMRVALSLIGDNHNYKLVAAALLHDVIEDTNATFEELAENFGLDIANLVQSVTKVSKVKLKDKDKIFSNHQLYLDQVDNYRKLLFATASDPRGMILKLYDRLDNVRTIKWIPAQKIKFYARETIEIYAPIAERLGMGMMKGQLEDASFPFAYPEEYKQFKKTVKDVYKNPHAAVEKIIPEVKNHLKEAKINIKNLSGRAKFQYSLYKKLCRIGSISLIYDIIALRIIVETIEECYRALGVIHSSFVPIPGKISDYIAKPKDNGYQSIHTVVKDRDGNIFEIQIRTLEMHEYAEYGVASHWSYKEETNGNSAGKNSNQEWSKELEKLRKIADNEEFLAELKDQLFSEQIFVFTPNGDIIRLPQGSTPLDFAYRIHSGIGERCNGARINNRLMPLSTPLNTADTVEVITAKTPKVSSDWLNFVKTASARQKIKAFLKLKNVDALAEIGERKFEQLLEKYELPALNDEKAERILNESRLPYKSMSKAFMAIAENTLSPVKLAKVLYPQLETAEKRPLKLVPKTQTEHFSLRGIRHEFAKCCKPKETDKVVGYLGREHIIKVHKVSCRHLKSVDSKRLINLNY